MMRRSPSATYMSKWVFKTLDLLRSRTIKAQNENAEESNSDDEKISFEKSQELYTDIKFDRQRRRELRLGIPRGLMKAKQ